MHCKYGSSEYDSVHEGRTGLRGSDTGRKFTVNVIRTCWGSLSGVVGRATVGRVEPCGHGTRSGLELNTTSFSPRDEMDQKTLVGLHRIYRATGNGKAFGLMRTSTPRTRINLGCIITRLWIIALLCVVACPRNVNGFAVNVLQSVNVSAGESAILPCELTNVPSNFDIQWMRTFKNGSSETLLLTTPSRRYIQGRWHDEGRATFVSNQYSKASMKIFQVSGEDSGKYSCNVGRWPCVEASSTSCVVGTTKLFVDRAPKIQIDSSEVTVDAGQTLELTCQGAGKLTWVWPSLGDQNVRLSSQNPSTGPHTNTLRIDEVSAVDIGEYHCISTVEDQNWTSEPVYVYVVNEDAPLFLETEQVNLLHFWDKDSTIPCRVTNPNTKVTLLPQEIFAGSTSEETYDPRIGFTLKAGEATYSGNVSCLAALGNETEQQSFVLDFIGKPQLSVNSSEIVIWEPNMLRLVCTGIQPIHWSRVERRDQRLVITNNQNHAPSQTIVYESILELTQTEYTDTGRFTCEYERYQNMDSPQLESSVYVFVSSNEDRHFLPTANNQIFISGDNESFTVPCRVDNPNITVQLSAFYTITSTQFTDFNNQWDITYDPKVGFQVKPTQSAKPLRKLSMACIFSAADGGFATLFFKLHREGDSQEELFKPVISSSASQLIQGKDSYTVTCEIVIPHLAYAAWEQHVKPQFKFSFPNQEDDMAQDNVLIDNRSDYLVEEDLQLRFLSNMTIKKVSERNSGTYFCNVFNFEWNITLSTSLHVLASGYVKLSQYPSKQGQVEEVKGYEEVCLQVLMESFPRASYYWSKENSNLTNEEFIIREEHVNSNDIIVSGCIRNLTTADAGTYTLTAVNEYQNNSLEFGVSVLETPEVNLTVTPSPVYSDPPLFYIEQDYNLVCQARGWPVPHITWQWQSCSNLLCTRPLEDAANTWSPVEGSASVIDMTATSVLTVSRQTRSGVYRCLATSPSSKIPEPVHQDIEYKLTDFRFTLPPLQDEKTVFTFDPANLTCRFNIYAFSATAWWNWTSATNPTDSIEIPVDDGEFHYTSVLKIAETLVSNSGVYRCWAEHKGSGDRVVVYEVQLNVKEITLPVLTKKLDETYALDKKKDIPKDFQLECQATGNPLPNITWYKDGYPLSNQTEFVYRIQTYVSSNSTVMSTLFLMPQITAAHDGKYVCQASNNGGSQNSTGEVLLEESPSAVIEEEFYTKNVGDNLTIVCDTAGTPKPVITWKKKPREGDQLVNMSPTMFDSNNGMLVFKHLKETDYATYICVATNRHGSARDEVALVIHGASSFVEDEVVIAVGILAAVILAIFILCVVVMAKRLFRLNRKAKRNSNHLELAQLNPRSPRTPMSPFRMSFREEFGDQLPFDAKWEFPRERLKLGSVIGQGAFGMVLKGVAVGINKNDRYVPVAVKTVKSDSSLADRKALFGELKMLIQVGHHLNVVNFLGACTQDSPPLVIVEICPYGNLSEYLRSKRDTFQETKPSKSEQEENMENELNYADLLLRETCVSEPLAAEYELVDKEAKWMAEKALTVQDLVCYCFQVARGMEFLASRKCIHRDLAARNVLLSENNVVKICDFGLSRSFYHDNDYIGSGKGLLPIKWMAPEAIFDKLFTTYSDIWSFGVFTWEVFSLGGSPYPGVQVDEKFYDKMKSGYRMSCPDHAPRRVYQLMLECWSDEPRDRPMFSELAEQFGELLETNTRQEYIDLNIPYQEGQYCELDFSKTLNNQKPATVIEETETAQESADKSLDDEKLHFDDPSYNPGPKVLNETSTSEESTLAESCHLLPKDNENLGLNTSPTLDIVSETCLQHKYAAIKDPPSQDSPQSSTNLDIQSPETLPDDPYQTGTDSQFHTYTSVKGTRPGLNPNQMQQRNTPGDSVDVKTDGPTSPDDNKLHTYASIKVPRTNRTANVTSPTDSEKELDQRHLYSSIKGSRPPADPGMFPRIKDQEESGADLLEGMQLIDKPKLPEQDFQSISLTAKPKPPLPRRDNSTVSWSPETETLLSNSELLDADSKLHPVYV